MKSRIRFILLMAELLGDTVKKQNELKLVGLQSFTKGAIIVPDDWDEISEEEKSARLAASYDVLIRGGEEDADIDADIKKHFPQFQTKEYYANFDCQNN